MALDQKLNSILKEMWRLDEKIIKGEMLEEYEQEFYSKNIEIIQKYYASNSEYWNNKKTHYGNKN